MKKGFAVFSLLLSACLPLSAEADDECYPETGTVNICDFARNFADSMAPQLPMRMSQNLTMEKVLAIKDMVSLHVILGYDEAYLNNVAKAGGMTMEEIARGMRATTKANLCREGSPVAAFIALGGRAQYVYKYADGMLYLTVSVGECA